MNTNCHICDRADCPTLTLPFLPSVGLADCANHTVNWRARALTETARADAAEARITAVAKFELAEWMIPMLDGLAMVLVQAERTGRPVATRLMCRVEGPGGDDDESEDVPMVSVWATTGDGNPIDRCAELSAKVLALGGEP